MPSTAHVMSIQLAHLPPTISIYASLHTSVTNASHIRTQLLSSNADYDFAFIDASAILSTTHILAAVFRAVNDLLNARLKSRNVHSEVVFSLGSSNNISDALRRFGISDKTTSLIAIKIIDSTRSPSSSTPGTTSTTSHPSATTQDTIRDFLSTAVEGTAVPFSDAEFEKVRDVPAIAKLYKLGATISGGGVGGGGGKKAKASVNGTANGTAGQDDLDRQRKEVKELEVQILGLMAIKGA